MPGCGTKEIMFIKADLLERLDRKNGSKKDCKVREGETTIFKQVLCQRKGIKWFSKKVHQI